LKIRCVLLGNITTGFGMAHRPMALSAYSDLSTPINQRDWLWRVAIMTIDMHVPSSEI